MAKILAPNKKYCGVSASVPFVDGVGYTEDEDLIKWFDDHGYEVEYIKTEDVGDEDVGDEDVEDIIKEKPKGRTRKSKPKSDESGDKTEGEPGDESNDSGEDKPE